MFRIICDECGKEFWGRDEYEVEVKWMNHVCDNFDELMEMSFEELRNLVYSKLEYTS